MKTGMYRFVLMALFAAGLCSVSRAQDITGVALEYDSSTVFSVNAAEEIRLELVARDLDSNVYNAWDLAGRDVVLTVDGSYAEADTNTRSWSADPDGYSWRRLWLNDSLLTVDSVGQIPWQPRAYYTIPHSRFVNGRATLRFVQSQQASGIVLSVISTGPILPRQSPPISVRRAALDHLFLRLTTPTQGPDKVFLLRRYELVVWPRDRYMNVVDDSTISVAFTARFPNEFDQRQSGVSEIFGGTVNIKGTTNYYLSSRIRRVDARNEERQWVSAFCIDDSTIIGRTDPYEILDHAPNPFALLLPEDSTEIKIGLSTDLERFTWTMASPQDPYTDIQISMFDPAKFSDEVKYKIRFLDAASLTRVVEFESEHQGSDTAFTISHAALKQLMLDISGRADWVIWYVEATDLLFSTNSLPPQNDNRPGNLLYIDWNPPLSAHETETVGVPSEDNITLHPNYPNPFNPGTVIPVEIRASGHCTLQVLDLMGKVVAVPHDGFLEAGLHCFSFDASDLPSGVYSYRVIMDGATRTRPMLLLR